MGPRRFGHHPPPITPWKPGPTDGIGVTACGSCTVMADCTVCIPHYAMHGLRVDTTPVIRAVYPVRDYAIVLGTIIKHYHNPHCRWWYETAVPFECCIGVPGTDECDVVVAAGVGTVWCRDSCTDCNTVRSSHCLRVDVGLGRPLPAPEQCDAMNNDCWEGD